MNRRIVLVTYLALAFLGILGISARVQVIDASMIFEAGEWMKYEVTITPILEGEVVPTWIKLEFISFEGTNATVQITVHLSDGDEWNEIINIDIASGSNIGFIIPFNSKIGDPIYISGYGNISIGDEKTLIYTGVNRTAVHASYSNSTDSLTCYWDKQTGILLEQDITKNESNTLFKIEDTNIWQTQLNDYNPYKYIFYLVTILGVILALAIFLRMRKKKPRRRSRKRSART